MKVKANDNNIFYLGGGIGNMGEMVVCLTAFALREESSASWSGAGVVEHCRLAWGLPAAEGAAS